jgi:hypothetical protein
MAKTLFQGKMRQQYLIIALALAVLLALVMIWQNLLKKSPVEDEARAVLFPAEVKINWPVLQDEKLTGLQIFSDVKPFEGTAGRKDPFISY